MKPILPLASYSQEDIYLQQFKHLRSAKCLWIVDGGNLNVIDITTGV